MSIHGQKLSSCYVGEDLEDMSRCEVIQNQSNTCTRGTDHCITYLGEPLLLGGIPTVHLPLPLPLDLLLHDSLSFTHWF